MRGNGERNFCQRGKTASLRRVATLKSARISMQRDAPLLLSAMPRKLRGAGRCAAMENPRGFHFPYFYDARVSSYVSLCRRTTRDLAIIKKVKYFMGIFRDSPRR